MAQGRDDFDDDDEAFESFPDPEVARLVLELDWTITRRRRSGAMHHLVERRSVPLPVKPSHIELRVLTALAQAYGSALLQGADFEPVLDCIAEWGAVVLVQRSLWGERSDDLRLAARLLAARVPFEILCGTWPEVFMAQGQAELQEFRPQPPKSSMASDGEEGGDD
ncbi:hypothetical protein AWB67_06172 [Caballeronia terrestris]|uniref:Uncharacterized protein n=1 Tax=Caballeronia terrestris TaxID=1226301 RepID=A0A158KQA6_9BURK|nr:hypothetical protein [Caballeronia terrestris]SAL82611.1 hypothetical protein AWB67_06172 [Caballeronia terrestris]